MMRVTYAGFRNTQGVNVRGPEAGPCGIYGYRPKPAAFTIYRADLHEEATDCTRACNEEYRQGWSHDIGFPHVDFTNAEEVTVVTPLCGATWITHELAQVYATYEAPAFEYQGIKDDRALVIRGHHRHCQGWHRPLLGEE